MLFNNAKSCSAISCTNSNEKKKSDQGDCFLTPARDLEDAPIGRYVYLCVTVLGACLKDTSLPCMR